MSFVYTQCKQTVLSGATTPGLSRPDSHGNERKFYIFQSWNLTIKGFCIISRTLVGVINRTLVAEMQLVYSTGTLTGLSFFFYFFRWHDCRSSFTVLTFLTNMVMVCCYFLGLSSTFISVQVPFFLAGLSRIIFPRLHSFDGGMVSCFYCLCLLCYLLNLLLMYCGLQLTIMCYSFPNISLI